MYRILILQALILLLSPNTSSADEMNSKAAFFIETLRETCLKHVDDVYILSKRVQNFPSLAKEEAEFVSWTNWSDWVIPGGKDNLVLTIPKDNTFCMLRARRLNIGEVKRKFIEIASNPSEPIQATLVTDLYVQSANGSSYTLSYRWFGRKEHHPIQLTLVISSDESDTFHAKALVDFSDIGEN